MASTTDPATTITKPRYWTPVNDLLLSHKRSAHLENVENHQIVEQKYICHSQHHQAILEAAARLASCYHAKEKTKSSSHSVGRLGSIETNCTPQDGFDVSPVAVGSGSACHFPEKRLQRVQDAKVLRHLGQSVLGASEKHSEQFAQDFESGSKCFKSSNDSVSTGCQVREPVKQIREESTFSGQPLTSDHKKHESENSPTSEASRTISATSTLSQTRSSNPPEHQSVRVNPDMLPEPPSSQENETPMKPFLRRRGSLTKWDHNTSAIPLMTPAMRIPTCFRIAELLRLLGDPTEPMSFAMELFAVASEHSGHPAAGQTEVRLADIFFPGRPPYILGYAGSGCHPDLLEDAQSDRSSPDHVLFRTIVRPRFRLSLGEPKRLGPNQHVSVADPTIKTHVEILSIRRSDWHEVRYVRGIVDPQS